VPEGTHAGMAVSGDPGHGTPFGRPRTHVPAVGAHLPWGSWHPGSTAILALLAKEAPVAWGLRDMQRSAAICNVTTWNSELSGGSGFVRKHPVATKQALRAILKATDL
jgi:hypothetical protein